MSTYAVCLMLYTRDIERVLGRKLQEPHRAKYVTDAFRADLSPEECAAWLSYKLSPSELCEVVRRIKAVRAGRQRSVDSSLYRGLT